jgi:arginine:pyruvate transaminase
MANLSKRITSINSGGDDGWGLFYRARAMKAAGLPIVELSIGEHDIRTDQTILAAMAASAQAGHTGYAAVAGTRALRQTIATRVQTRTGVPTTPDNVMVTPGGQSALFSAHVAVANPGQPCAFIDPFYATYPGTVRAAGGVARAIPTLAQDGFAPTRAALTQGLEGCASLLVNTPNNPTGAVYSAQTLATICEAVRAHDCWLISDEVYDTQIWDGTHLSPRAIEGMAERTLVIGSMSKSHAMTGSRIGWIIGPQDVIAHISSLATNTTYGVPGYIQDAADFALNAGDALEISVGAPFKRRRILAQQALAAQNVVRVTPSGGAMYLFFDISATGLSGSEFTERLLDQHHISVMPGESFGASAAGHIRVAMTVGDAAFITAVQTILDFAALLAKGAQAEKPRKQTAPS